MSRLDSFIRRMQAQRDGLNWAASLVASVDGPIFELGLGNGRTYDHLRERFAGRDIYVLEREIRAHPDCVPATDFLILGDVVRTLPDVARAHAGRAALIHYDLGSGDADGNLRLARRCAPHLAGLLHPLGVIISSERIDHPRLAAVPVPEAIPSKRYFFYAVTRHASRPAAEPSGRAEGAAKPEPALADHRPL